MSAHIGMRLYLLFIREKINFEEKTIVNGVKTSNTLGSRGLECTLPYSIE